MNLAYRKLALLEKDFIRREEFVKKDVCYMTYIDTDMHERVTYLLDKIRTTTIV